MEIEFISIAFERFSGADALSQLEGYKRDLGAGWTMLLGGPASKAAADSTLPFMGGINSFPTTAFVPYSGEVVVHSGFCGPATGLLFDKEVALFHDALEAMARRN